MAEFTEPPSGCICTIQCQIQINHLDSSYDASPNQELPALMKTFTARTETVLAITNSNQGT